jgi:acyl carrier protein
VIVRRFAVLPAAVLTIAPEVFPRSSIGKIQRSKRADRLARGEFDELIAALEQDTPHQEEDTQPRDEIEGRVAEICHDLLGISKVGVETNLLEVGVTSLLMVTLRQALERDFDTVPPLAELYQLGTIASIATTLR